VIDVRASSATTDWGKDHVVAPARSGWRLFAAPIGVAVVVALVMGSIFLGLAGLLTGSAFVIVALAWLLTQGRRALRSVSAAPAAPATAPRLFNIVEGLAPEIGAPPPTLYVYPSHDPNAFVCNSHGPALAVSAGMLEGFSRTELEAVIAHCLVRMATGAVPRAGVAAAFGSLSAWFAPVGWSDDVRAVAVTRYPPALASALRKAKPARGHLAPFYFAASSAGHRASEERAAAVLDL
jgi:hypothetical protein